MSDNFVNYAQNFLTVRVRVKEKVDGVVSYTDLGVQRCATVDIDKFYEPAASSESSMQYFRKYKHLYCLDKWAQNTIKATLYGSALNRHDDYREVVFDVVRCKPDTKNGVCTTATAERQSQVADMMEAVIVYDS